MKIFIFVTIPLRNINFGQTSTIRDPSFPRPSFDISKNPVHLILPANKNESKMQSVSFKLRAIIPPPPCLVSITNERAFEGETAGAQRINTK